MADVKIEVLRRKYASACEASPWGEAAAVTVLLGCERIAGDRRFARFVTHDGVYWDSLLNDVYWSDGERFLIATAAGLWTGRAHGADVSGVPSLDDEFYAVWLAMVTASRTGKVPRAFTHFPPESGMDDQAAEDNGIVG